ncbi:MAG: hypothetical protein Q4B43_07195 [Bacteroidota bacterium]|nr:hypothetical protein [Bacteroidota bacterium]
MNKPIHVFYGLFIGLILTLLGTYLYVRFVLGVDFMFGIDQVKSQNNLGKLLSIGAIPNIVAFFLLLQKKREFMARGIVLSLLILAIGTLFLIY